MEIKAKLIEMIEKLKADLRYFKQVGLHQEQVNCFKNLTKAYALLNRINE